MKPGVRIGVDVGAARVGVSACDAECRLVFPVETIAVSGGKDCVPRLREIAEERGAVEIVVGLPVNLAGRETASTAAARRIAARLGEVGHSVRLIDERLSTVSAAARMHEAGRSARRQRSVIDQEAAVIILEQALRVERGEDDGA